MSTSRMVAVATIPLLLAGVITSCSNGSASSASGSKVKIGFAAPVVANPYWRQNIDFARTIAGELGASVVVADANSSETTQLANVQNLISQGVDGIIFGPVTASVGPAILKACQRAKIKCAAVARQPGVKASASNADYYVGYVIGNDFGDGRAAAAALDKAGARNCVVMSGQEGNSVADDRLKGFLDYAKSHEMTIMDTFRPAEVASEGQQATENFLAEFPGPKFDCLYAFDGDATTGALSALSHAGVLSKVKVAGLDANTDNLKAIKAGTLVASTAGGEFVNGGLATIMVYDAIKGHEPTKREVVLDGVIVEKGNVDDYSAKYAGPPTGYDAKNLSRTYNAKATTADLKIVFK
jgi:ABC-type sugar transport system substrate-binding protein